MKKIIDFLKDHTTIVISILLLIIFLQCCGSCSKKQKLAFKDTEIQFVEDSLNFIIKNQMDTIIYLNRQISHLEGTNSQLKDANTSLREANNRPIIIKTNN